MARKAVKRHLFVKVCREDVKHEAPWYGRVCMKPAKWVFEKQSYSWGTTYDVYCCGNHKKTVKAEGGKNPKKVAVKKHPVVKVKVW